MELSESTSFYLSYVSRPVSSLDESSQENEKTQEGRQAGKESGDSLALQDEKGKVGATKELTRTEQNEVEKLKKRDQEVRTHENSHVVAGGQYIRGAVHFDFERGPDGKSYAVGGHVNIDVAPVPNNPEATLKKMQVVKRAAMAPADPSGADHSVARKASMQEQKVRQKLMKEDMEKVSDGKETEKEKLDFLEENSGVSSNEDREIPEIDSTIREVETPKNVMEDDLVAQGTLEDDRGVSWATTDSYGINGKLESKRLPSINFTGLDMFT